MTEGPARGTRPRNRRALILDAASDLFVRDGYPQVAMRDIAEAVAITPSALYRHFSSKEEILAEAVSGPFASISSSLQASATAPIDVMFSMFADMVLDMRGLGILWQRESRHLEPARRDKLRGALVGVERFLSERLRTARPELTVPHSDLLAWAAMAGLMSVAFQRVQLPREEYVALLAGICTDIVATPLTDETGTEELHSPEPAEDAPTADRLIAAATRLFAERGFQTVGIDDVASAIGIAGPSVYHHFGGKAELLAAAMGDAARQLRRGQAAILQRSSAPQDGLRELIRAYVDFSFENPDVLDLMITETASLPPQDAKAGVNQQRRYVAEWVRLVEKAHPQLPSGHARVRVQATLTITNDIARTRHLRSQPGARSAVAAVGRAVLR